MLTRIVTFAVTLLLLLSVTPALTQSDSYNGYVIQHYNDENGLPQNSVNDLLFDKNGYLWLGTQVGLVRFNGNSFKLFYPDDKPAMESNVTALAKMIAVIFTSRPMIATCIAIRVIIAVMSAPSIQDASSGLIC